MLKYPCLVLDHDDTVVQSMKTLSYPFFCYILERFRPGRSMTLAEFVSDCHHIGFAELCRKRFQFTPEEIASEHVLWMNYLRTHTPDPYPGISKILEKQKSEGGLICVVSHSSVENIERDYTAHFPVKPDAIYGWDLPEEQRKPKPFPILDIMERYQLTKEQLLVIDDMKLGWMMAAPLGVPVAYAGWGELGVPEITEEMTNLCDFAFETPEKLYQFLFND